MIAFLAAVASVMIIGGCGMFISGVRKTPEVAGKPRRRSTRPRGRFAQQFTGDGPVARRNRLLLFAGLGVGATIAVVSGWLIALLVVPAAFVGLPMLLMAGEGKQTIARIEAMEEWTRSLAGVLGAGVGLEQAIQATLSRSTPAPIRSEVAMLVARLRARWATADALRAFADDLDDATGDAIVAGLLLAADRRGNGLSLMLEGIAERAAEDVRNRRRVEADLAKPRSTARWVTLITIVVLAGMVLFSRTYIAPYGSFLGQIILAVLLSVYVACLLWMRRMARGEPVPRFLVKEQAGPKRAARIKQVEAA